MTKPAGTARVMAYWGVLSAVSGGLYQIVYRDLFFIRGVRGLPELVLFMFTFAVLGGAAESILIRRTRRPVYGWWLGRALGAAIAWVLVDRTMNALMGMGWWYANAIFLVGPATFALCMGAATALPLWGLKWPSTWPLWFAGLLLLRLLGAGLQAVASPWTGDESLWLPIGVLHGALMGTGTAWLLDRLVFRVPGPPKE